MGDIGRLWRNNKFKHGSNGKAITEKTIQKMQGQYENMSIISYRTSLLRFKLESDRNPTEIVSEHGNKIGNVDQLLALLYVFKIFIYLEYSKTYHFV